MAESRERLLSGRYRLVEEIGRGGMGTVWWAYDETAGREVAVKEIHLPPSLDRRERANLVKRTNREAMSAGRLRHPGLVAMLDVVVEDDRPWLVMEYIAARSLEDVFGDDGPISPLRVAEIGRRLLDALCAAHAAGIVHRDVKPSNVLLETSGRVVLTDFGIATYDGATTLTQSGTFMGSPAYVAPEVASGERATPASDLWSLGATLYAAVEGRPPYDFDTAMATLSALVTAEPDPPVRAGPLRPLLDGLLRKDPARRLTAARAAELLAAVAAPPLPRRPGEPTARGPAAHAPRWTTVSAPWRPGASADRRPAEPTAPELPQRHARPPAASGAGARRRFLDRPGVTPAVTGGVLSLAIAAGVLVGLNGWAARRDAGLPPDDRSAADSSAAAPGPAQASPAGTGAPPAGTPGAAGPSGTAPARPPAAGALPAALPDAAGRPAARRLARAGGVWPDDDTVTLAVPGRARRVGVIVLCRAGDSRLSFTARVAGGTGRSVSGDCVTHARHGAVAPALALPAGAARRRIRIRLRAGPEAGTTTGSGPVGWLAGAYAGGPN